MDSYLYIYGPLLFRVEAALTTNLIDLSPIYNNAQIIHLDWIRLCIKLSYPAKSFLFNNDLAGYIIVIISQILVVFFVLAGYNKIIFSQNVNLWGML